MKYLILILIATSLYSKTIVGTVYDSFTNEAVPNVKLMVNVKDSVFFTNSKGEFSLNISDTKKTHIDFVKSGYMEKHLKVSNEYDSIKVFIVPMSYEYGDITVTDRRLETKAIQNVSEAKINDGLSNSLSDILRSTYGISSAEMGEAVSRPILNGLSGNRLSIVNNNFTAKDLSANSVDHSQAYTLNNAKNVSILFGPDLIRYSSSLVGKSVHTNTNLNIGSKIEETTSLVSGSMSSVNNQYSFATKNELDYLLDGIVLNGIYTKAGDVSSPLGVLKNTSFDLYEISGATFYQIGEFNINPYGTVFRKTYGVPGGFVGSHPNGVDIKMERNSYGFNSEYHLHNATIDKFKLEYERSFYDHKEYESKGLIGAQFRFVSNSVRFELLQHQGSILKNGYWGIAISKKDNKLGGLVFIPNNSYLVYSPYMNEEISLTNSLTSKLGVRYEAAKIDLASPYVFQSSIYKNLEFNSVSSSVSLDYKVDENMKLNVNVSQSNRVPEPEELFSDGPHLAAYSYDIGNPNLKLEKSMSYAFNAEYNTEKLRFTSELFYYDYSNYITPTATGDTNYSTLLPIYRQVNMPAKLYGLNLSLAYDLTEKLSASSNMSYTIGKEKLTGHYLPLIPPLTMNVDLEYKLTDWQFKLNAILTSSQEDLGQFEQRTDGYIVLNAEVKKNFNIDNELLTVIGSVNNITNETYRNHLSRIKSVYPQPGIGAELTVNLYL